MAEIKTNKKVRTGFVTSDKMDKTVTVAVERKTQHPMYKRVIKKTKKYKAHDESNECNEGDKVRIIETRPLSKSKRWRVLEIIDKAK
ncbi:MAG TPA: 30S ribosomal protein S17 [Halanaerobiales bacterium]|nr:30S ribosomal protein S17 [Halanaerobiales bacterium]